MKWRRLFYTGVVALWLMPGFLCLELYERVQVESYFLYAEAYSESHKAEVESLCEPVYWKYARWPMPPEIQDKTVWNSFAPLDEAARQAFAETRGELILVCEPSGKVVSRYVGNKVAETADLAKRVRIGESLTRLFTEEAVKQDALQALKQGSEYTSRDYPLRLPSGENATIEFHFMPMCNRLNMPPQMLAVAVLSVWEKPWIRFRKNIPSRSGVPLLKLREFRTNNLGFIGDDVVLPKPAGVYRIACIGGSTTAEGITPELTYPAILQRKLRDCFQTDQIEVINCGIHGLFTPGEIKQLPDVFSMAPDLIIHYNFINDLRPMVLSWMPETFFEAAGFSGKLKWCAGRSQLIRNKFNGWLLPSEAKIRARLQKDVLKDIATLGHQIRKAGIDVAFCSFAYPDLAALNGKEQHYFDARTRSFYMRNTINARSDVWLTKIYNSMLKELCEREHFPYIPVDENLTGGYEYFTDICHMNTAGIAKKADIILEAIRDEVAEKIGRPQTE